jgi:hypothetical protein
VSRGDEIYREGPLFFGAPGVIRTHGLLVRSQTEGYGSLRLSDLRVISFVFHALLGVLRGPIGGKLVGEVR